MSVERNIALRLRYDGTDYHGWQTQKSDKTVQQTLELALSKICGHAVKTVGCGRTDAGVHALSYCANFHTASSIPADKLPLAVNALLPRDIAVLCAVDAPDDFNAIGSCIKKEYVYLIHNARIRDPFLKSRACYYPTPLDIERMQKAAAAFCGTHDFKAVRSVGTETKTTVRTVFWCEASRDGDMIEVRVCANGFLYKMARSIVGTLVYCSHGKLSPEDIPGLLLAGERMPMGPTMPPGGLYLRGLWYDGAVGDMMLD